MELFRANKHDLRSTAVFLREPVFIEILRHSNKYGLSRSFSIHQNLNLQIRNSQTFFVHVEILLFCFLGSLDIFFKHFTINTQKWAFS